MNASGIAPGTAPGFDEMAAVLRELAQRFGETAFSDRRRLLSLLQDRLPDARRDIRAVSAALDERVFDSLLRCRPEGLGLEVERLAANLENGSGLRPDVALPVVHACAYALGLGPLPSVAAGSGPGLPGTAPAAPGGDGWIGVSEPVRAATATGDWVGETQAARPVAVAAPGHVPPAEPGGSRYRRIAMWAVPAVIVVAAIASTVRVQDDPPAPQRETQPAPQPAPQPTPQLAPQPAPQPLPQPSPQPSPQPAQFFAGENRDFGVPPQSTLKDDVGSPTPTSIPGARTVSTAQVFSEMRQNHGMLLVDTLEGGHAQTIQGAAYLPTAGRPGGFGDAVQSRLAQDLARLTRGQREMPLVFFCLGAQCWESYNAALRARTAGYPNVFWYRGGLQAWAAAGLPMQPVER